MKTLSFPKSGNSISVIILSYHRLRYVFRPFTLPFVYFIFYFQIWRHILTAEGVKDVNNVRLPFRQKSVYYLWHQELQNKWKFTDDPFKSAQDYLLKLGPDACLKMTSVMPESGTSSLAFHITDIIREWAGFTQEVALDSTCMCFSCIVINY